MTCYCEREIDVRAIDGDTTANYDATTLKARLLMNLKKFHHGLRMQTCISLGKF